MGAELEAVAGGKVGIADNDRLVCGVGRRCLGLCHEPAGLANSLAPVATGLPPAPQERKVLREEALRTEEARAIALASGVELRGFEPLTS